MEYGGKIEIVERVKKLVVDHGWITIEHACGDTELNINIEERNVANYKSISALLLQSEPNKYIREPVIIKEEITDYGILMNPNYQFHLDVIETNSYQRKFSKRSLWLAVFLPFLS